MNETNFDEDVEYAKSDNIRRRNYQTIIKNFNVKSFDAKELEEGKDSYDFTCELKEGTQLKLEFKNRRIGNKYDDVALEVYNDNNRKTPGWVFKLIENEVDYVIYTWHEKPKKGYIILKAKELEKWWRNNFNNYKLKINKYSYTENSVWQSSWCPVPIKDIPPNIIYKYEIFPDLQDFWVGI